MKLGVGALTFRELSPQIGSRGVFLKEKMIVSRMRPTNLEKIFKKCEKMNIGNIGLKRVAM